MAFWSETQWKESEADCLYKFILSNDGETDHTVHAESDEKAEI